MASKGGRRIGAGRPKAQHTIQAEAAKKLLISMFEKEKLPIFKALLSKAKEADIPAIKELFERVWGKVPQTLSDPDGDPVMPFQLIIKQIGTTEGRD